MRPIPPVRRRRLRLFRMVKVVAVWRGFNGARDSVQSSAFGDPRVELTPSSQEFGTLKPGERLERRFTITNTGNAALRISSLALSGQAPSQFTIPGVASCSAPLLPAENCEFSAAFEPSEGGDFHAELEVLSDATSSPYTAPLTGKGLAQPANEEPPQPNTERRKAPSNRFTFGKATIKRDGSAEVILRFPGPGTLRLSANGAAVTVVGKGASKHVTLSTSGNVRLRLALSCGFDPRISE